MLMVSANVRQQYQTTDLLQTRIDTHARYSERTFGTGLHAECAEALRLTGDESLLDVGCGPGAFGQYLRAHGHTGRLAGLDQSAAMIAEATAASAGMEIDWHIGQADHLPFLDDAFNIISARHMLYHVADIPAALREFARVVGPNGTVFATTNSRENLPLIGALKDDLATHFGLSAPPETSVAFNTSDAPGMLGAVYPVIEETVLSNALVFTEAEPIVAYVMTMMVVQQTADRPESYTALHRWLHDETTRRLAAMGGVWRDPKDVGLYVCRVSP